MRVATFLISAVFCLVPVAGIVWILVAGTISSVDGLFMSLILLSLFGVFLLNAFWELRDTGLLSFLHKKKAVNSKAAPPPQAS